MSSGESRPDVIADLAMRAEEQRVDAERREFSDDTSGTRAYLELALPNGRHTRSIMVSEREASAWLSLPLGDISFVGRYEAYVDRSTGVIEALVGRVTGRGTTLSPVAAWRLPGAEIFDDSYDEARSYRPPESWRWRVSDGIRSVELSPLTEQGRLILDRNRSGRYTSVKLEGFSTARHDDALADLEAITRSIFFELDLLYGFPLATVRQPASNKMRPRKKSENPANFPRNAYPPEAVELYNYGRNAAGLPLLQFLAYYQALEFFFPAFAREQTIRGMRNAIRDPRFNAADDSAIARLISLAAPAVQAGVSERQQLAATIRGVVEPRDLIEEIQELQLIARDEYFTEKKQQIRGLPAVRLVETDIREQLAERIYDLRCRIVHTKGEGGIAGGEILLPNSHEATQLRREIPLLQYLVQKAICAQASTLEWMAG